MKHDPELKAMQDVYATLEPLDENAKKRVISWISEKFSLGNTLQVNKANRAKGQQSEINELKTISSIGELFAVTSPRTDMDKVLVVSAFLQEKFEKAELTGREINGELHNLGHRVSNVTVAILNLMKRKPQLMIQTKKEGKSQQSQKKYRVSSEGLKVVTELLSNTNNDK